MARLSNYIGAALEKGVEPETIAKDLGCSLEDVLRHMDMPGDEMDEEEQSLLVIRGNEIVPAYQLKALGAEDFADDINGPNNLARELRVTAGCTLRQAQKLLANAETSKDVQQLATAIAAMQNAFFSRPNSVIITPPNAEAGVSLLQAFKERLRS